jgi:hypothetical protein
MFRNARHCNKAQLRAKRGRGEADVAIQNHPSLRVGAADVAIQNHPSLRVGAADVAIQIKNHWIASLRSQ